MNRPRNSRRAGRLALIVAAFCAVSGAARADPSQQDKILAESLFREAQQLTKGGKIEEACSKFAQSYQLDPQLGGLLYLATCHEQIGKTATAWLEFTEAAETAARTGAADRERIARERAADLERRLSRLVIETTSQDAVEVLLDRAPVRREVLGSSLPVDPGAHVVEARASGRRSWSQEVRIEPDARTTTVRVPALELEPSARSAAAAPPRPRRPTADTGGTASSGRLTAGRIAVGLGVIGLGVAGVSTGILVEQHARIEDECPHNQCSPRGLELAESSRALFGVNAAGFIAGGLGLGIGTLLILTSRAQPTGKTALRASAAPTGGALGIERSF